MNEWQNVVDGSGSEPRLSPKSQITASSRVDVKKTLDAFTILKSTAGSASKRIVAGAQGTPTIIGFNAGALYNVFEAPVSCIRSLSFMLTAVEARQDCLVIRGAPRADLDIGRPQRRQKTNFRTPPRGRQWVLVDVDKVSLPPGLSLREDIDAVREHVIGLLPAEFHRASHHWQLSSSAGITDPSGVSLHLWFWLDRPVSDAQLKAWSADWNARAGIKLIDPALFNDVQPHYTAAPVFDGVDDPFPVRSGLVRKKEDEVALKLPAPKAATRSHTRATAPSLQPSAGFEALLGQIGDHPGGLGFHRPIIRAIASYVATHGGAATEVEALYERVRARVLEADSSAHDAAYVEQMASRDHIVPAIEQAVVKFGKPDPRRKSRQVPGVPPHFKSKPLDAGESSAMLKNLVDGFFERRR